MNGRYYNLNFPNELKTPEGFYDRDDNRKQIASLLEEGFPRPIVIVGERRVGKTSLRHVALADAERAGYVRITPTFRSYSLAGFVEELLSEICMALGFPIKDTGMVDERGNFRFAPTACSNALRRVFASAPGSRVIVDIDEFDYFIRQCTETEGKLTLDFMGKLIDREQYASPLKVFLTMTRFSGHDRYGYVNTFLQSAELIMLDHFRPADTAEMARDLLLDALHFPDETLLRLHKFSGGHPFFTKLMLKHLYQSYYLQESGRNPPGAPVQVSPEMLDNVIQDTVEDEYANLIMENIISEHMSAHELSVLDKLVQAGGALNLKQLTLDERRAAYSLARRHYLKHESDDYAFNVGYLYHFFEKKRQLIAFRSPDPSPRGPLRFQRGRVFRGYKQIHLDEDEFHLFSFLYERREALLVPSRTIFDHMGAVGCFTLSGIDSPAARNARVKALVMKLRRSIEDDADSPVYLIDAGPPDAGYRLQNVESD